MNLQLPLLWRVYFALRKLLVRTLRVCVASATFVRWPWAVFWLMKLQQKLGFRFHR